MSFAEENMPHDSLHLQEYLIKLFPHQSRVIFKCRSGTVDIKTHFTHKYKDLVCRGCKAADEELCHIVNCGHKEAINLMDMNFGLDRDLDDQLLVDLKLLASRVTTFLER